MKLSSFTVSFDIGDRLESRLICMLVFFLSFRLALSLVFPSFCQFHFAWFRIFSYKGSGSFDAKERVSCLILSAFKGGKERSNWLGLDFRVD